MFYTMVPHFATFFFVLFVGLLATNSRHNSKTDSVSSQPSLLTAVELK